MHADTVLTDDEKLVIREALDALRAQAEEYYYRLDPTQMETVCGSIESKLSLPGSA